MSSLRPSRTAQAVAAERAVLTDLGVVDDRYAAGMLSPEMRRAYRVARRLPRRALNRSITLAGLAGRVLWHDAEVTEAMDAGVDQIVVIGGGYDSRAWRLARDGVRFFEVDHRATQEDKRRRAPGPGPTFVEVDLRSHNPMQALDARGFDTARPALFVMEGVTMYLTEEVVRRRLSDLVQGSAGRSRLSIDFYPPQESGDRRNRRQRMIQDLVRKGGDEEFRLGALPADATDLVASTGWTMTEMLTARQAAERIPDPRGLPVSQVSTRKSLVAATRP